MHLRQQHNHGVFSLGFESSELGVSARTQLSGAAEEVEQPEVIAGLLRRLCRRQTQSSDVKNFVLIPAGRNVKECEE